VPAGETSGGALLADRPLSLHLLLRNHAPMRLALPRMRIFCSSAVEVDEQPMSAIVPARREVQFEVKATPRSAGYWFFHGMSLEVTDRLGFYAMHVYYPNLMGIKVFPRLGVGLRSFVLAGEEAHVEGFEVGVLTKSDLVLRDVDILSKIPSADVGFSITCLDCGLAAAVEPGAPSPSRRLAAMRQLSLEGIPVWGFFAPVLPTLSDAEEEIAEVLRAMAEAGATRVLVDAMNLYPKVQSRVRALIARSFPDRLDAFDAVRRDPKGYLPALSERVETAARGVDLEVDVCF